MESYKVQVKRSAVRSIAARPKADCQQVVARIERLARNPRPVGSERMTGDNKYRLRLGDHRILYTISEATRSVTVFKVGHLLDIYR